MYLLANNARSFDFSAIAQVGDSAKSTPLAQNQQHQSLHTRRCYSLWRHQGAFIDITGVRLKWWFTRGGVAPFNRNELLPSREAYEVLISKHYWALTSWFQVQSEDKNQTRTKSSSWDVGSVLSSILSRSRPFLSADVVDISSSRMCVGLSTLIFNGTQLQDSTCIKLRKNLWRRKSLVISIMYGVINWTFIQQRTFCTFIRKRFKPQKFSRKVFLPNSPSQK